MFVITKTASEIVREVCWDTVDCTRLPCNSYRGEASLSDSDKLALRTPAYPWGRSCLWQGQRRGLCVEVSTGDGGRGSGGNLSLSAWPAVATTLEDFVVSAARTQIPAPRTCTQPLHWLTSALRSRIVVVVVFLWCHYCRYYPTRPFPTEEGECANTVLPWDDRSQSLWFSHIHTNAHTSTNARTHTCTEMHTHAYTNAHAH